MQIYRVYGCMWSKNKATLPELCMDVNRYEGDVKTNMSLAGSPNFHLVYKTLMNMVS